MALLRARVELHAFDCPPTMPSQHPPPTPPPSPVQGLDGRSQNSVLMAYLTMTNEQVPFDASRPWQLCRVPGDHIDPRNSPWDQIQSARGILIFGKTHDGKFYRVAINEKSLRWLRANDYSVELDLEPLAPEEGEVRCQGRWVATCNAENRFLLDAVEGIFSGRGPGFELTCRELMPPRQRIQFEWACLSHDVLESHEQVQQRLAQALVFISLNVLKDYDKRPALALLRKDRDAVLQPFRDIKQNASSWCARVSVFDFKTQVPSEALHWISIIRSLLEFCEGRENFMAGDFDPDFTDIDNSNFYAALLGISGSCAFGEFDVQKMRNALAKSELFANGATKTNLGTWTIQLMAALPFKYPRVMNLPNAIQTKLPSEQANLICIQAAHIYNQHPRLRKPENDILVLLIWSSIDSVVNQIVAEWASSGDGWLVYDRTREDARETEAPEQLGLDLVAMLCQRRLLHHTMMDTITQNGSSLSEFDDLVSGLSQENNTTVLEYAIFSFFRVLEFCTLEHGHNISQILPTSFNMGLVSTMRYPLDALFEQYWTKRLTLKCGHEAAYWQMELPPDIGMGNTLKISLGVEKDDINYEDMSLAGSVEKLLI